MNWPPSPEPLEGSRVRLEPIAPGHYEALRAASRSPEIWTWIDPRMAESEEVFAAWFNERLEASRDGSEWCYVTRTVAGDEVIGSSSYINVRPEHDRLETGWTWLHPSAWRTGANLETRLLMWGHAFEALGCVRIVFMTDAENDRVRPSLEAVGVTLEGIFRKHLLTTGGGYRDLAYYAILDDEWPEMKATLERRLSRHVSRAVADA